MIVVTNPLDAMCHVAADVTEFPRQRLVGMAGILDSARFRTFLAWELGVSVRDVTGFVLGGHGDTMVPVVSYTNVAGVPISQQICRTTGSRRSCSARATAAPRSASCCRRAPRSTRPSAAAVEMVDSIVFDQKRVLPCAALCQGEYGIDGLFVGVPVRLGAEGVEEIVEIELGDREKQELQKSGDAVRELVDAMAKL